MVFADMAETQIKQVRRQSLDVYILLAYRNVCANGKKILSFKDFHRSQTAAPCQAASTDTI